MPISRLVRRRRPCSLAQARRLRESWRESLLQHRMHMGLINLVNLVNLLQHRMHTALALRGAYSNGVLGAPCTTSESCSSPGTAHGRRWRWL